MSIPALTKTYHAHANVRLSNTSTSVLAYQSIWWAFKALLTNQTGIGGEQSGTRPAGSVWAHVASCDGTSVSTTTDLWGSTFDASKLVPNQATFAHSWWKGTNGTHDILLDMNFNTANIGRIGAAPAGAFSAGSTTSGPVAATDWYAGNAASNSASTTATYFNFSDAGSLGSAAYAHLVTNESDHSFQFHISRAGAGLFSALVAFQVTSGAADSYNRFFITHTATSGRGAPTLTNVKGNVMGRRRDNGGVKTAGGMTDILCGGTSPQASGLVVRDAVTGLIWAEPIEIRDLTPSHTAKRGTVADWLVIGTAPIGSQVDGAGVERRVIGDFLMPFPGVVPII